MHDREQIIQLGKVLAEEQRLGYSNTAAAGGLEQFLHDWRSEVNGALDYPAVQQALELLPGYGSAPPDQRAERIDTVLGDLRAMFRSGAAGPTSASNGSAATPAPQPRKRKSVPAGEVLDAEDLATPLRDLKDDVQGLTRPTLAAFARLGVRTVEDLLYHVPHRYDDYSSQQQIAELEIGAQHTIIAKVADVRFFKLKNGRDAFEVTVNDSSGSLKITFFGGQWMAKNFPFGRKIVFSGKVTLFRNQRQMSSPRWEPYVEDELTHTGRLVPVHPLTKGLHENRAREVIKTIVEWIAPRVPEHLPNAVLERTGLLPLDEALAQIHFPDSRPLLEQARTRLAFDELLLIQLGVVQRRIQWQTEMGYPLLFDAEVFRGLLAQLPFSLTGTVNEAEHEAEQQHDSDTPAEPPRWNWERHLQQQRSLSSSRVDWSQIASQIEPGTQMYALCEIFGDLQKPVPMARLLQGDVGSGKTAVAAAALLQTVANGFQGALMAPTEILAEQHYKGLRKLLGRVRVPRQQQHAADEATPGGNWQQTNLSDEDRARLAEVKRILGITEEDDMQGEGVRVALLTGTLTKKERQKVLESIRKGEVDLVIGTHALISDDVQYNSLGLVCIDEQHRFGVEQRERLKRKGYNPHLLVMTATPIPRTLTLTIYGDLDVSVIHKLPPGRQEIRTRWIPQSERYKAYRHMRREIENGRQAFVICPLVEESEKIDLPSAEEMYDYLQSDVFRDLRVGLIHGRMLSREKDEAMVAFRDQEYAILVATAVVEVGIDIPNASTIMIEGAERFGLAQLHQFRGRVGRGQHQSYCILVSDVENDVTRERLTAMEQTRDGFKLAEIDLKLRGPGEFLGTRQSGMPDLKVARLDDTELLAAARREAELVLSDDPQLSRPEHRHLHRRLQAFWHNVQGTS